MIHGARTKKLCWHCWFFGVFGSSAEIRSVADYSGCRARQESRKMSRMSCSVTVKIRFGYLAKARDKLMAKEVGRFLYKA